jgi:hypothetical protein
LQHIMFKLEAIWRRQKSRYQEKQWKEMKKHLE